MKKILIISGTRPEAIKMAPLIKEFENYNLMSNEDKFKFEVRICITAQHREMLDQVFEFFNIKPDYDLNLMKTNQTLFDITANGLKGIKGVLEDYSPDFIFVQGDTTTTFVGALAGFYKKIKVIHIEAGLRTNNKYSPFPEEINRKLVSHIADYHFAPTIRAKENLYHEGLRNNVYVVGNTVIDALFWGLNIIKSEGEYKYIKFFDFLDFSKKIILVTGHRRESFGKPFKDICYALKEIANRFDNIEMVYPMHMNPNVRKSVENILKGVKKIHLIEPLEYSYFIWLMNKSYLILTDSGGIQEEAPSLGKPVLVMREETERKEGIEEGTAKLVGTNKKKIFNETKKLITDGDEYNKMAKSLNPYGDGNASKNIVNITSKF